MISNEEVIDLVYTHSCAVDTSSSCELLEATFRVEELIAFAQAQAYYDECMYLKDQLAEALHAIAVKDIALMVASNTFTQYALHHRSKIPADTEKDEKNSGLAFMCNEALEVKK